MRIHSDKLTRGDLSAAIGKAGLTGVWIDGATEHGSRKRRRAFEVRLAAEPAKGRRRRNTGTHGAESDYDTRAATYDEHGAWMAQLYLIDAHAIIAYYANEDDFHAQTKQQYRVDAERAHATRQEVRT